MKALPYLVVIALVAGGCASGLAGGARGLSAPAGRAPAGWRNEWAVGQARRGRPTYGLRLQTRLDGDQARVTVTAGFAVVPAGDVRIAVMVTEDDVAKSAQCNFQSGGWN
jgi:hypothetical protein